VIAGGFFYGKEEDLDHRCPFPNQTKNGCITRQRKILLHPVTVPHQPRIPVSDYIKPI
jgi:hypothetical protein